ncbi:hypothetical protein CDD80_1310 [Ophiocordyceps camponoti-rufipedis]|uniref:Uncharacterized protein n=1 Tax=Ophiocordyceps camponoti-rufipedis TaxID=2004952 RepID=A0A2C5ZA12_9HYPO|nr:hypothetical protein CDD80_1310 [Ophiocordyceps camponoti-rufipedis]
MIRQPAVLQNLEYFYTAAISAFCCYCCSVAAAVAAAAAPYPPPVEDSPPAQQTRRSETSARSRAGTIACMLPSTKQYHLGFTLSFSSLSTSDLIDSGLHVT